MQTEKARKARVLESQIGWKARRELIRTIQEGKGEMGIRVEFKPSIRTHMPKSAVSVLPYRQIKRPMKTPERTFYLRKNWQLHYFGGSLYEVRQFNGNRWISRSWFNATNDEAALEEGKALVDFAENIPSSIPAY